MFAFESEVLSRLKVLSPPRPPQKSALNERAQNRALDEDLPSKALWGLLGKVFKELSSFFSIKRQRWDIPQRNWANQVERIQDSLCNAAKVQRDASVDGVQFRQNRVASKSFPLGAVGFP